MVIVGGGPTGLMLACELVLAGADVVVLEQRDDQTLVGGRARGINARSIELLDQRGIADRFLARGTTFPRTSYAQIPLAIDDLPTPHPYTLAIAQQEIEHELAAWANELGVDLRHGCEVAGFEQHADHVEVELADGTTLRTRYLVGCDGGRSRVRALAGIELAGADASTDYLLGEVVVDRDVTSLLGVHRDARGMRAMGPLEDGAHLGVVLQVPVRNIRDDPTLEEFGTALSAACETELAVTSARWLSRFSDAARQATTYRDRRVLLAGDAAHVHSPVGGQGLNLGLADAVNLGWKLGQVVRGVSDEELLDTYETEQRPVAAKVLRTTLAATPLMDGSDTRHGEDDAHELTGRRLAGLDLRDARPALVPIDGTGEVALVRPDGHVAWAGAPGDPACDAASQRWFGTDAPQLRGHGAA